MNGFRSLILIKDKNGIFRAGCYWSWATNNDVGTNGRFWLIKYDDSTHAWSLYFYSTVQGMTSGDIDNWGLSIRFHSIYSIFQQEVIGNAHFITLTLHIVGIGLQDVMDHLMLITYIVIP